MARYIAYVLKVPLNPEQPTNQSKPKINVTKVKDSLQYRLLYLESGCDRQTHRLRHKHSCRNISSCKL